jgi:hypothetical protein
MSSIQRNLGKKAARATARHSWNGLASKAQRRPLRSVSLLTAGGVVGGVVGLSTGWFVGRKTGPSTDPDPAR